MNRKIGLLFAGLALAPIVGLMTGCQSRREMLENVARDWCETIRASQIIPVYPLTEDLQPGDVFLVQMPTSRQQDLYRRKGFLPLDDHRTRLKFDKQAYRDMYFEAYWADDFGADLPHARPLRPKTPTPTPAPAPAPGSPPSSGPPPVPPTLSEAAAPRAAFPTYSFEISTSTGLALALPIKGVPIGFGFLNARRATGSVTIADARTYGVDSRAAHQAMNDWAADPYVRRQLDAAVRNNNNEPLFLRVITRVYLTGAVSVTLTRANTIAADASAGKAPEVDLIKPGGEVNKNHDEALAKLNANQTDPASKLPDAGGRVKFVGASASSVSLVEYFDRLLVVGYIGLDVPILPGGQLGHPVPTFQRLEGLILAPDVPATEFTAAEKGIRARLRLVSSGLLKDSQDAKGVTERHKASRTMRATLNGLDRPDPGSLRAPAIAAVDAHLAASADAERDLFAPAAEAFRRWAFEFIGSDGAAEGLDQRFTDAFDTAFDTEYGK
jgi:hypothetical protein